MGHLSHLFGGVEESAGEEEKLRLICDAIRVKERCKSSSLPLKYGVELRLTTVSLSTNSEDSLKLENKIVSH